MVGGNKISNRVSWHKVLINGQILPPPKICPKRGEAKKGFCFSSSCFAQKRGSRLGAQETEDSQGLAEVRAPRLRVGGEKIRLLCPTEVVASL